MFLPQVGALTSPHWTRSFREIRTSVGLFEGTEFWGCLLLQHNLTDTPRNLFSYASGCFRFCAFPITEILSYRRAPGSGSQREGEQNVDQHIRKPLAQSRAHGRHLINAR